MVRLGSRQLELPWKPGGRSGTHCCQSKRLPSSDSWQLTVWALCLLLFAIALMRRASLSCWRTAGLVWSSSRSRAGAERRGRGESRGRGRGALQWGAAAGGPGSRRGARLPSAGTAPPAGRSSPRSAPSTHTWCRVHTSTPSTVLLRSRQVCSPSRHLGR